MSTQSEDAILNVKINGSDAISTFNQLNKARTEQLSLVKSLNENTPEYDVQNKKLQALNAQYSTWKQNIYGAKEASESLATELKEGLAGALETLGIGLGVGEIINFGKELFNLEVTASGVEQAFSKIGNTEGMIEKLRTASRGLLSDLDLEKLSIKANNANIPLEKMGTFLAFATQRARDTGQSVDDLTTKLIEGLAKGSTRALGGLGINVQDVKDDFKQTGDMVTSVANIINRQMGAAGKDVDTFGDKVGTLATKWENLKDKLASVFQSLFAPELADPEKVEEQTNKLMKSFDGYQQYSDAQLKDAVTKQQQTAQVNKLAYDNAQKQYEAMTHSSAFLNNTFLTKIANTITSSSAKTKQALKESAEAYQASRNVIDALQKEEEKRQAAAEHGKPSPGQADESKRRADALLAQAATLTYNLDKLNAEQLANTKSTYDQELAAAAQKYNDLIKAEHDYQAQIKRSKDLTPGQKKTAISASNGRIGEATGDKENDLNNVRVKQAKEVTDAIKQYQDQQTANFNGNIDKQIAKNNQFYDALKAKLASGDIDGQLVVETNRIISNAKTQADGQLEQQKRYEDELQQLKDEYDSISDQRDISEKAKVQKKLDSELAMYKDQLNKKLIDEKQYEKLVTQAKKNAAAADQQIDSDNSKQWKEFALDTAGQIADGIMAITKQSNDDKYNAQIQSLESQKEADLSNVNLTASQRYQITQKYKAQEDALKLKQWQADKDASIEQALINEAVAVTKALTTLPWPANLISAAGTTVAAAFQIAQIEKSKPPQFADGGWLPSGPSHAAGGLNVIDPLGRLVANIEGGEPVLSRATASANPNLVNALLGSGGQTLNYEKAITAGYNRASAPRYTAQGATGKRSAIAGQQVTAAHIAEMKAMITQTMQMIAASDKKPVVLSNRVVDDNNTKMVQIHDAVNG